uniref:hypothetical protein n=1 Tax=Rhodococcus opacus TaxID=37919 RepID=UPI003F659D7A
MSFSPICWGATTQEIIEAVRQIRGDGDNRQVPGARAGLVAVAGSGASTTTSSSSVPRTDRKQRPRGRRPHRPKESSCQISNTRWWITSPPSGSTARGGRTPSPWR